VIIAVVGQCYKPNLHYINAHKLLYGRCCYAHKMHYLPQMLSVQAIL